LRLSLLFVALIGLLAAAPAAGHSQGPTAKKKCTNAIVDGKRVCLKVGQKCQKKFQADYVRAGLSCKRNRLRKASIQELRGPEPLLIEKNGQLSVDTALAAFDATIAPLPGVNPEPGEIGNVGEADAVITALEANADKLTAAQRQVVEAATTPAADAVVIPPEEGGPVAASPPDGRPTADRGGGETGGITITAGTLDEQLEALKLMRTYRDIMRGHGFALLRPVSVSFLQNQGTGKPTTRAYTTFDDLPPFSPGELGQNCNIFVTAKGRAESTAVRQKVYAHELAHCAQHAFVSSEAEYEQIPDWVIEGGADWLGAMTVKQSGSTPGGVHWAEWFAAPSIDLFRHSYGAIGFFAMIQQAGVDGWAQMRNVLFAAPGGNGAAYRAATAGLPDIFYKRWGPGLVRDKSLGEEWDYEGPGIESSTPATINLAAGRPVSRTIAPRGSYGGKIKINAEIFTIKAPKGTKGLLSAQGSSRPLKTGAYCTKAGGCKCRTNTNLQLPKIGSTVYFGFNDPSKTRTVTFAARKLKDYCKHPTPGPGGGGEGGGGEGGSCPVTPTARPTANRDCPTPSPGITVLAGEAGTQVANFTIGSCTRDAGFTALAESNGWNLEVGISAFGGFGDYQINYNGADPQVVVEDPSGAILSNTSWAPPNFPFAGAIHFDDDHHMGLGFLDFRTADQSLSISAAGGMTCVYPDDEP
jgi:hypothetical protein